MFTLIQIKEITNKYSTRNYTKYFAITYKEKESKLLCLCVCVYIHIHTYILYIYICYTPCTASVDS